MLETKKITVSCTDSFYTDKIGETYHLIQGNAMVYIVPWKNGEPQRQVELCSVEKGQVIPALCYGDRMSHVDWRFSLVPLSEDIVLEVIPCAATNILKRRFLEKAGVKTYDIEGFEGSLIELCLKETLTDRVFIDRVSKSSVSARKSQMRYMYDMLAGDGSAPGYNSGAFLKVAAFALKALNVKLPDSDKLKSKSKITLDDLKELAGFSYRDVVLEPDWYQNDCGVILATLDGRSVACVPTWGAKYILYDGESGKKTRLTREQAAAIDPKAKVLERMLPDEKLSVKQVLKHVVSGIRKSDVAIVIVLEIICTLIGILMPKLNQRIYDDYIPMGNLSVLTEMCVFIGTFMIGNIFFTLVKSLFAFVVETRAGYDLQNSAYRRIFRMPQSFFRRYDSADLAQRLMSVGGIANSLVTKVLGTGLASLISFLYIFEMIKYAKSLTVVSLLMVLVYALLSMTFSLLAVRKTKIIAEHEAGAESKLFQFISGIDKIRMTGVEERALSEYMTPYASARQEEIKKGRLDSLTGIFLGAGSTVFSMVLYYLIVKRSLNLSIGNFIAFNTAFGTVSSSLMSLVGLWLEYVQIKPTVERVFPVVTEESEAMENKDDVEELKGAIAFRHVSFAYDKNSKNVLNDLSFSVAPGEYVGIVGPSGCGKSTIMKLLLGFEKPLSGSVTYDDKDIGTVNMNSLRRKIGTVLQNGNLISGSIFENISISTANPTMAEVEKTIEMVGLKDDVARMPMGIHTMVSESGGTISGGQKQRILIARAIYNKPSVLLFDEATSALDNVTQSKVTESLATMHITRVVIAHRLSTIKNCDRILVINNGEIVEEGNYDTLMAQKGMFRRMATRQLVEEDTDDEED